METIRASPGRELELDARAAQLARDDPLLDDPAAALEALEVVVVGDVGRLQAHRVDAFGDPQQLARRARAAEPAQLDDRVALAGDAVVELDHDLPDPRPDGAQARDRGDHVGAAADVLDPERVRDAGAREQLAPAALGPEVGERGVGAVDRQLELLAERELELGADVRDQVARPRGR